MHIRLSLLSLWLTATAHAQNPGSIVQVGNTVVSAMMVRQISLYVLLKFYLFSDYPDVPWKHTKGLYSGQD
jgi:hypothetical protein